MTYDTVEKDYRQWLSRQPLANQTRQAYLQWVIKYLTYLSTYPVSYGDPLTDSYTRDYAVRDFKAHLKTVQQIKPASVNLAIASLDHFYIHYQQLGRPRVKREPLPQQAPRALDSEEQKRFLRAVDRHPYSRDKAIASLLFYTGLRISECVALNRENIALSERKGQVVIRQGKGDRYREVPLNSSVRTSLSKWLQERQDKFSSSTETALFLSRGGKRLSRRSIDALIRRLGQEADLVLSAHVLRHTCLTNLVRQGHDLVLIAEIAGHQRLDTTRRYSLPNAQDRTLAMDSLEIEI